MASPVVGHLPVAARPAGPAVFTAVAADRLRLRAGLAAGDRARTRSRTGYAWSRSTLARVQSRRAISVAELARHAQSFHPGRIGAVVLRAAIHPAQSADCAAGG